MVRQQPDIFLSLGSNEGDRPGMLKQACDLIGNAVGPIRKRSSIYETEPWGMGGADPFLNQVIQVTGVLPPPDLLRVLQGIELKLGRIRDTRYEIRETHLTSRISCPMSHVSRPMSYVSRPTSYVSRPIDIDILFFGTELADTPELTIPHPFIAERRFVLVPLAEIAGEFVHPKVGEPIKELLAICPDSGIVTIFKNTSLG